MATPTIDETFNDFVAINQIAIDSLHELGKVRVKSMTEEDLRKLVLSTSKAILCQAAVSQAWRSRDWLDALRIFPHTRR